MVDDVKYINSTSQRIAERNARAEAYMRDKSPAYKAVAKTGLFFGNAFDRISSVFTNEYSSGAWGIVAGGIGAAILGTAATLAIAAFSPAIAGAYAAYIIGGSVLLGAATKGIQYYKQMVNSGYKKKGANTAERIGEMSGALEPQVALDPYLSPEEALKKQGRDPDALKAQVEAVEAAAHERALAPPTPSQIEASAPETSFAQRELDRRARSQATVGTLNPAFNRA